MQNQRVGLRSQVVQIGLASVLAILAGCADTEPTVPTDSVYFTVIHPVATDSLAILEAEFSSLNPHVCSNLNSFGYTEGLCGLGAVGVTPGADRSRIVEIVKQELVRNVRFTGVVDSTAVSVWNVSGAFKFLRINFSNQRWEGFEVLNTGINVNVDSVGVVAINGNHYTEIQIPGRLRLSAKLAQASLIGLEIPWYDFGGQRHVTRIDWDSLIEDPEKVILPRRLSDRIELRFVWRVIVNIWEIYVDTMTGEQLGIRQVVIF